MTDIVSYTSSHKTLQEVYVVNYVDLFEKTQHTYDFLEIWGTSESEGNEMSWKAKGWVEREGTENISVVFQDVAGFSRE